MSFAVCLITAGLPTPSSLGPILEKCGATVWTPATPGADDGHIYKDALCLLVDMPADEGVRTLRLLRDYGVKTPAILVTDSDYTPTTADLAGAWVLNVIPRTADPREILRWIECMYVTRNMLEELHAAEEARERRSLVA